MNIEEFEQLVREALEFIPEKFKKIIQNEKIEIIPREKMPLAARRCFPGKSVFGVFIGLPYKDRFKRVVQTEPTRIELYQESFEKIYGRDKERIKKEVLCTVTVSYTHLTLPTN